MRRGTGLAGHACARATPACLDVSPTCRDPGGQMSTPDEPQHPYAPASRRATRCSRRSPGADAAAGPPSRTARRAAPGPPRRSTVSRFAAVRSAAARPPPRPAAVRAAPQPQYGQPQYGQPPQLRPGTPVRPGTRSTEHPRLPGATVAGVPGASKNALGVWALVTGILGVIPCCSIFIVSIGAIVLGVARPQGRRPRRGDQRRDGDGSLVLGIVGIVLGIGRGSSRGRGELPL